nr:hypothetical protein [Gemmatimonas sp.]
MTKPIGTQFSPDSCPVVGNAYDQGPASGRIREAGELPREISRGTVVFSAAGKHDAGGPAAARLFFDVHLRAFDVTRRRAGLQRFEHPLHLLAN